ncbi:apolipoprotein N-acyltransferase [Aestuariivirga litoralis]|uniref:apolipoprotein N-acyltransferase n=1 Tax=Aestuariivirga litoralis TaxID=2650924 RepID=UPI0018C6814A|nr:apolipoprotein N-acyltransferase [Aestuariivirga litoralis]MBG1232823.1 apolipoprotein N-acyltransferase [Aestuariivirga litoralis]
METLQNLLQRFAARHQALKLFVLGALAAIALPPTDLWPVLFITVPLALVIFTRESQSLYRRIAWLGWLYGLGYFIAALHWIAYAFFVNPERDLWMMPIALGSLAAFMAVFWMLAILAASFAAKRSYPLWLVVPATLAMAEWLRGHLFTGFPWSALGQMSDGMFGVEQLASIIGMTGLSLMVPLWASAIYGAVFETARRRWLAVALLITFPLSLVWGQLRLASHPTAYVPDVMVRLVQPNINQNEKWLERHARKIYDTLLALNARPSSTGKPITHIIWPESSVPFLLDESAAGRAELAKAMPPGATLMAGAVRRSAANDQAQYFTSILVLNDQAQVLNHYDKWHLVPGGEFLPLAWALEPLGLRKVVSLPESFTPGPGPTNLEIPGAGLAGMSICYEAIFPDAVAGPSIRPNWLINVTNDGWFGKSTGPYQHLAQLRLRSIEQGLPAARAANTGISSIIDPLGRVTFQSLIGVSDAYDLALPQPVSQTTYGRLGDCLFFVLLLVVIGLGHFFKKS